MSIWPQLLDPTPAVVANAQFARALAMALNRQEMVDTIQFGLAEIAYSGLDTTDALYRTVDHLIVKHPYDPRQATALVEGLGYGKGSDGSFRDAQGNKLALDLRTSSGDIQLKTTLAVADQWQRVGVAVDTYQIPIQRQSDREYRATFPSFQLLRGPPNFALLDSSLVPVPANNFTGGNYPRYMNPDFDRLLNRYNTTIPLPERWQVMGQLWQIISQDAINIPLFSDPDPHFVSFRMKDAAPIAALGLTYIYQWEVL